MLDPDALLEAIKAGRQAARGRGALVKDRGIAVWLRTASEASFRAAGLGGSTRLGWSLDRLLGRVRSWRVFPSTVGAFERG